MNRRNRRCDLTEDLKSAAAGYQREAVIPHCSVCSKPCCQLNPLVLDMEWKQVKVLWRIEEPRRSFDRRLSAGQGPAEIRAADGRYFAHGKVCPAYDVAGRTCRVYGEDSKPTGCSDFPVYEDGDAILADLRCEAVDLAALAAQIVRVIGPDYRVVQIPDEQFPFLVTLKVKKRRPATAKR